MSQKKTYVVYMIECGDGSLYTGITTDIERRFAEHQKGTGSNYTRSRGVLAVVYTETCYNRSVASRREAEIKRLTRVEKLELAKMG